MFLNNGQDPEALEQESQKYEFEGDLEADMRLWRQMGPVGKLHNLVKWVRSSPQRSEYFREVIQEAVEVGDDAILLHEASSFELQLLQNNDTRWNSTYLMIERALRKQQQIQTFLHANTSEINPNKRVPEDDTLTFEDWKEFFSDSATTESVSQTSSDHRRCRRIASLNPVG